MLILSALGYISIGATISWASLAPIAAGDVVNAQTANHTSVQRKLGVNCRGNPACRLGEWKSYSTPAQVLSGLINQISNDSWYHNGFQIACLNISICAFVQYMPTPYGAHTQNNQDGGAYGKDIKVAAQGIVDHNCKECGSFPMIDDDVTHGELTFNIVNKPCTYAQNKEDPALVCVCDPDQQSGADCRPTVTTVPIFTPTPTPMPTPTPTPTPASTSTSTSTPPGNDDPCNT